MIAHSYDQYCRRCSHYQFDINQGVLCGLTQAKPGFYESCEQFELDPEKERRLMNEQARDARSVARSEESDPESGGAFDLEKSGIQKGVLGGGIMMAIALVWFVLGWVAGYIFFYPPILFLVGLFALIKGLVQGNLAGKRKEEAQVTS